jgi:hypothetical protein
MLMRAFYFVPSALWTSCGIARSPVRTVNSSHASSFYPLKGSVMYFLVLCGIFILVATTPPPPQVLLNRKVRTRESNGWVHLHWRLSNYFNYIYVVCLTRLSAYTVMIDEQRIKNYVDGSGRNHETCAWRKLEEPRETWVRIDYISAEIRNINLLHTCQNVTFLLPLSSVSWLQSQRLFCWQMWK